LDSEPEPAFDRLVSLAARLTGNPIALVSLIDKDRQWFKARVGLDATETPRAYAFCDHAVRKQAALVVENAATDPRFAENPLVTGDPGIRFYAGAPINTHDGHALGTLCVIDTQPKSIDQETIQVLQDLADTVMDELELRNALRELDRSNRRLTDAVESLSEGFVLYDEADRLVICNDAYRSIFWAISDLIEPGARRQDLVTRGLVRGALDPSDPTVQERMSDRLKRRGTDAEPFVLQLSDGRWIQISDAPTSEGGIVSIMSDISDTKAREQDLLGLEAIITDQDQSAAFQIAKILEFGCKVLQFDMGIQSKIDGGSYKIEEIYSQQPLEDVPGEMALSDTVCEIVIDRGGLLCISDVDESPYRTHKAFRNFGLQSYFGSTILVDGTFYGTVNFSSAGPRHPVTERERALFQIICQLIQVAVQRAIDRNQLVREREIATDASSAKSSFLAMMSHEIRTPLNGVLGMLGLLQRTSLTAEQAEMVKVAGGAGETLLLLINDILDFSKLEADRIDLEIISFGGQGLIDSVVDIVDPQVRAKHLDVVSYVDPAVNRQWLGDPSRIRQVLLNLISNAVKFTERGYVGIEFTRDSKGALRIDVRDSGIGIDESRVATLFQEFVQADLSINRRYGGTGLGLAICRKLVDLMGGEIGVDSMPGVGSRFWFTVPLLPADGTSDTTDDGVLPPAGQRVLVVDGAQHRRDGLCRQLKSWGQETEVAVDIASALARIDDAAAKDRPFDAILLDDSVAEGDGAGAVRGLAGRRGDRTKCIALIWSETGLSNVEGLFDGRLHKPLRPTELCDRLRHIAGRDDEPAADADQVPRPEDSSQAHALAVLVAEDNSANQFLMRNAIVGFGHQPDIAGNGKEALKLASEKRYDLILMDIQMPEMDGRAAMRAIRAQLGQAAPPIIALTAEVLRGDREALLKEGFDDYLGKPVDLGGLEARLTAMAAQSAGGVSTIPIETAAQVDPVVDLDKLRKITKYVPADDFRELLQCFLTDARRIADDLGSAVAASDFTASKREAHSLAGMCGNYGADRLRRIALDLETRARDSDPSLPAEGIGSVRTELEAVQATLQREFGPFADRTSAD